MKIIYGPVPSWRFGRSLGIDPTCRLGKVCSFDCVYCQLGETMTKTLERRSYIDVQQMKRELEPGCDNILRYRRTDPEFRSGGDDKIRKEVQDTRSGPHQLLPAFRQRRP